MKEENSKGEDALDKLKFSREQGFFDKNFGVRILIGLFFFITLFTVLHFREVRVEVLELSSVAPSYIVAQVDLDFFDEEATTVRRIESVKDLGKIYSLSNSEIQDRRKELETVLVSDDNWRKTAGEASLESLYEAMDELVKSLHKIRFTDPRTLQRMKDLKLDVESYMIFTPISVEQPVRLPSIVWTHLKQTALNTEKIPAVAAQVVTEDFSGKNWTLEEDTQAERLVKNSVQSKVPDVISHISAGSRIIDQGEKVTARHIAMLQAMKVALNEERNLWRPLNLLGSFTLASVLTVLAALYFYYYFPRIMRSNRKLFLVVILCILSVVFAKVVELFLLTSTSDLIEVVRYPLFIPFIALLLCSLMNPEIATFVGGFLTIILATSLSFDFRGFILMNVCAGITVILSTRTMQRRKEIFVVCAKAWLVSIFVLFSFQFYQGEVWNLPLFIDIVNSGIFLLLTGVAVIGILPLLEGGFGMVTDVTLMEYMDPNNDLLRRLSIEAPGTYQHSIVVGNLAEAAAIAIDANGLFCRVATLYHDVGKMATPQYFTENQHGGMNIHQLLTPLESAQVIMAHVTEGVSMARKAGLPEQFIDIIKEHHGTTLVYYFYHQQIEKMGNDASKVDENDFRYAGPKPRSKESAIIMMADTLEAASRSLESVDEESVSELADRLIKNKADDGQFDNCLLTFEEMAAVKQTLVKTLVAFSHSRVKYPGTGVQNIDKEGDGGPPSSIA